MADGYRQAEGDRRTETAFMLGTIEEVDLAAGRVRVKLDEEGWISDALPWIELRAGRVRTWSAPVVGEQVAVLSPGGEPAAGVVLRGIASTSFALPSASADLVRVVYDDQARDDYDLAAHVRTIEVPAGGQVVVKVGNGVATVEDTRLSLKLGSAELLVEDGQITLNAAAVLLGPDGDRKKVARVGDHVQVSSGSSAGSWPIVEGSDAVKAS